MNLRGKFHNTESRLCLLVWTTSVLYAIYKFAKASQSCKLLQHRKTFINQQSRQFSRFTRIIMTISKQVGPFWGPLIATKRILSGKLLGTLSKLFFPFCLPTRSPGRSLSIGSLDCRQVAVATFTKF